MTEITNHSSDHFKDKDALGHVVEAQAQGIISSAEVHGTEIPGNYSAGADATRETSLVLAILWLLLTTLDIPLSHILILLSVFSFGWLLWKAGRSAWLGWFRLERLHRILAEERWEIENYRQQEREELGVLYAAKGFEGKLLEDVLDVLMADNDRLLKVMVEEELGLSLATSQHPLKQAVGAVFGVVTATFICLLLLILLPAYGILIGAAIAIGAASATSARLSKNKPVAAIIWNLGIASLAFGSIYFLLQLHLFSGSK